jgi:hypothetical protein
MCNPAIGDSIKVDEDKAWQGQGGSSLLGTLNGTNKGE